MTEGKYMDNIYTVYGIGGFGREVMPLLRQQIEDIKTNEEISFYFIDDNVKNEFNVNGNKVLNFNDLIKRYPNSTIHCCIAISDKEKRKKLTLKCLKHNIKLMNVFSKNTVIMDKVSIGEGSIICPFVTITSNISIGKSFHANIYSYVAHDCKIGDFVTFAPGVKCNGNVHIMSGAYIGTGVIIHPGTKDKPIIIGTNSKIAAGAVVRKDVPDNVTMVGNPAQVLIRKSPKK